MRLLESLKEKLSPDEIAFYRDKLAQKDKKCLALFNIFNMTADLDDLVNSMQRLYKRSVQ